ncbi:E3 ubiquitin-protein ligase MARCHF6 [Lutzomyia longipalpis]|uniref:E3 ubiquitin-protein ligase MARCHF6 n=1 Tax=Lutzomyia longipalpis TaxID=7200 RepID=UPI00248449D6|nr:E3 ubiquitin-protein ligase MARCHF6 [Lutzomyia longipalpis]
MEDLSQADFICRVCRCEGQSDRPLFHPCICTGSIKWIHQDCLMQWMRYSRKEYCELCGHRFGWTPIYSPDMPRVLPLRDVAGGLLSSVATAVKYWFHYTLVALAWLGVVPFTAYRTYRFLFSASYDMLLSLPINMFSTENIAADVFRGCFVVTCTLFSFIGLVWLREQILHGGGPEWLERDDPPVQEQPDPPPPPSEDEEDANQVEQNNNNNNNNDVQQNPGENLQQGNPAPQQPPPQVVNPPQVAPIDRPIDRAEPPIADPEEPEMAQEVVADEANWNPMEWDRAAEELTWERLLGLDGSMVFLEHVFWVISLNTLFIFIFAFCPYTIGNVTIYLLGILKPGKPQIHFHGLLTTLLGYCIIGITLVKLHALAKLLRMRKSRRILGLCYIVVKVSLLSVVEIGVLPLVCGWWLDICSLPMFDATLKDRKASFKAAPGTSLFIHWMFGMVYVYYFASFIILLREVLRPGVLWFLRNLNDPDFSPIQEMIHFSILRHIRRLVSSAVMFGSAVLLMLWLPISILKNIWPTFLPYTLSGDSEVNELSLQLLLLQIILPGFFEQSQTRIWLKGFIRIWCNIVSWILGIRSYLLGSENHQQNIGNEDHRQAPEGQGLGAAHQALLHRDVPVGIQPYERPSYFIIRLGGLIVFMCISLVIGSLLTLTIPVWIGRQCMALWSVSGHISSQAPAADETPPRPHELYTAAMGTYLCWIISRGIAIAVNLFPQGRQAVMQKIKHWVSIGASYAMAAVIFVLMFGVVPLLYGLLLELVVVVPLRVPLEQTPILFLGQDWALGVLYTKITCALTLMGPDWALKRAIERAYRDGLRDIDLKFIIRDLAAPVIMCFGLALAIPYVLAHSILPIFFTNQHTKTLIARRIYPFFLIIAIIIGIIIFQIRQFKKLYVAIKNDKYLVGQRLVNYDHRKRKAEAAAAAAAAAQAQMI